MWTCPNCGREFKRTHQSHYCGSAPTTIEEYISRQEQNIQPMLTDIKNTICKAIPNAQATISWSMPTWKKNDYLLHFVVNKNHIAIYPGEEAVESFREKLAGFETGKGVIRIKKEQEPPLSLITEIAKWCYQYDENM